MALTVALANTGSQNGTGTTLAVTLGVAFDPGDILVAMVACDNGGTNGAISLSTTATITGETVTNRRANNHDPGAAAAGDTLGIWTCVMAVRKVGTETITFTKVSADFIAVNLYKVSSNTAGQAPNFLAVTGNVGADAASTSIATGATVNVGELTIGCTAYEGNTTVTADTDTTNGSWSTQTTTVADSGTTLTSMSVASQYKVQATAGSVQTYDTSFTSSSCQAAVCTFSEVSLDRSAMMFRFYDDAGVALAAENIVPLLTGAQNKNVPLHLRVALRAGLSDKTETANLEWSYDQATWHVLETQTATTKPAFRYANGSGTAGGTVTSLLSITDTAGIFVETAAQSITVTQAQGDKEFDFAFKVRYAWADTRIYLRVNSTGVWFNESGTALAFDTPTHDTWVDSGDLLSMVHSPAVAAGTSDGLNFESYRPKGFYDGTLWWLFYQDASTLGTIRYRHWDGTSAVWSNEATRTTTAAVKQSVLSAAFFNSAGTLYVFVCVPTSTTVTKIHRGTISGTTITWDSEASLTTSATDSTVDTGIAVDQGGFVWIYGQSTTELFAYRSTSAVVVTAFGSKITNAQARTLGGYSDGTYALPLASNDVLIFRITGGVSTGVLFCSRFTGTATAEVQVNPSANVHNTDWGVCINSNADIYCIYSNSTATSDTGTLTLRVSQDSGATWTTCTTPSVTMDGTSTDGMWVTDDGARGCHIWYTNGEPGSAGNNTQVNYKHYTVTGSAVTTGTWTGPTILFGTGMGNGDAFWVANLGGNKVVAFHERGDDDFNDTPIFYIMYGALALSVVTTFIAKALSVGQSVQRAAVR